MIQCAVCLRETADEDLYLDTCRACLVKRFGEVGAAQMFEAQRLGDERAAGR